MLDEIFLHHVWVVLGVWVLLYCSDYALTILCARMRRRGVDKHLEFENFELTPFFQKDVEKLRWISPRFLLVLGISSLLLAILWTVQAILREQESAAFVRVFAREGFRFAWGALALSELEIHLRHLVNVVLFAHVRRSQGVSGKLTYRNWLTYRVSAARLAGFSVLYLVCALTVNSWFFAGGSLKCLVEGAKHWGLAGRGRAEDAVVDVEVVEDAGERGPN